MMKKVKMLLMSGLAATTLLGSGLVASAQGFSGGIAGGLGGSSFAGGRSSLSGMLQSGRQTPGQQGGQIFGNRQGGQGQANGQAPSEMQGMDENQQGMPSGQNFGGQPQMDGQMGPGEMPNFEDGELPELPDGATFDGELPELPDGIAFDGERPELPDGATFDDDFDFTVFPEGEFPEGFEEGVGLEDDSFGGTFDGQMPPEMGGQMGLGEMLNFEDGELPEFPDGATFDGERPELPDGATFDGAFGGQMPPEMDGGMQEQQQNFRFGSAGPDQTSASSEADSTSFWNKVVALFSSIFGK